jgi:hypothetical protein
MRLSLSLKMAAMESLEKLAKAMAAATRLKRAEIKLPAIHASAGVCAWYRDKLRLMLAAMHKSMLCHLLAAWKEEPPTIGFAQDATSTVVLKRAVNKWGALWQSKFNTISTELARAFAARNFKSNDYAMSTALKAAGFTVAFKPTPKSIEAYHAVVAEQVGLIKSIPQQYLKGVQTSVYQSVMRGGDLRTLSVDLQKNYGVSFRRAAFISRDQNNKARAVIENVRRQDLGLEEAIWQHSGGGKEPRPTHVAMSGKRYKLKQGMWDSAEGKYIWPGELPNCRCVSRAVIPGFIDDD